MGDRSNIAIQEHDGNRVWLYGHWQGERAISIVASVLARGLRLDDSSYLARIVFCEMVQDDLAGADGYGISTYPVLGNYPDIVINPEAGTAWLESDEYAPELATDPVSLEVFERVCAESTSYAEVAEGVRAYLLA